MDATYFSQFCLVVYQEDKDLTKLLLLGVKLERITCDGAKSILKAIQKTNKDIVVQRCLVPIQRMCLIWLTKYPKHQSEQELRRHILLFLKIRTNNDRTWWINELNLWHERYKAYINEKTINPETERYWYTHKLLRRSYFTIKRALPNMFHYLENPNIPKTTNGIEGYFSHLKNHLDLHRGLTLKNRINFIKWYIYFSNEK